MTDQQPIERTPGDIVVMWDHCLHCTKWTEIRRGFAGHCVDCFVLRAEIDRRRCGELEDRALRAEGELAELRGRFDAVVSTMRETSGGEPTADLQALTGDLEEDAA